jgi:drug/metabolite transporter (DMT)-like permease
MIAAMGTSTVSHRTTSLPAAAAAPVAGARWQDFVLMVVLPGAIWGTSFLFMAQGLHVLPPAGVTFVRIAIGLLTLSLVPAARRPLLRSDWGAVALLALLWLAFPLSMFPLAEQWVSSALAGMLNGAVPLFTVAVGILLTRQLPGRTVALGLLVGMAGTVLIALPDLGTSGSSVKGVALVMAALVSYGCAMHVARPLQQRNGALPVMWRALAIALVLTAPLGLPSLAAARWSLGPWLALLALGALGTAVAQVLSATAAGRLGAARASATVFITPVVALALGVVFLHERVALLSVLGCAVCLLGAWVMGRK